MKLVTSFLGLFALFFGLLASMAAAAPFSTITTCTTTTVVPSASASFTTVTTTLPTSTSLTLTTTTITMPSSTATSYTTVTAPVPTGTTVPEYGQCGGLGYYGPTTCESPFACVCTSDWWCQCQAETAVELGMEDQVSGNEPADKTSPAFHPNFITSTYWPSSTLSTWGSALGPSRTSFSDQGHMRLRCEQLWP